MEGGWEEYRLLHQYERDFQRDAKYLLAITLLVVTVLVCGSAFEILHVDIDRNIITSESSNTSSSQEHDKLSVFTFSRCLYRGKVKNGTEIIPSNVTGTDSCDLAVFGSKSCEFEKVLMYITALTVATSFFACLLVLIGSLRTICTKKPNVRFLWFSTTSAVVTTACACAAIVTMIAADNALCSAGSDEAAASLPGFHFGPGFWLLIAAPVIAVANAALSLQTC